MTIYVALLDEDVAVWRPVQAKHVEGDVYEILPQKYDREDEKWEFDPGRRVLCRWRQTQDGRILAATALADI